MGLRERFGLGPGGYAPPPAQKPKANPGYDRIHRWIESRIGKMDPADPVLKLRLENLMKEQMAKYPSPRGRLIFTRSGNDTLISGDTRPFKRRFKRLGCKWDGKRHAWVAKDRLLTESDVENTSELGGLEAYIRTVPYRQKF